MVSRWDRVLGMIQVVFLQHFCADPEPFLFVDTHAGRGIYDLAEGQRMGGG